jgi:VanZ family protein
MIGLMYWASTDLFSGENTRSIIAQIVLWFRPHIRESQLNEINFIARKMAHFTEYAILAFLLYRALRADSPLSWRWRWAAAAFGVVAVWALLDEYHQSFTHYRGASIRDSILDCSGALFALVAIGVISLGKRLKRNSASA